VSTKSAQLLTKLIPDLVNGAVAALQTLGDQGDADALARYADLAGAPGAARVVLDGIGGLDVYFVSQAAALRIEQTPPSVPMLLAVELPLEAVDLTLEDYEDAEIHHWLAQLQRRLVKLSPKRTRDIIDRLASEQLRFHVIITDTPDFDEVRVKIAFGDAVPPVHPSFTVTLAYDTLEHLRARRLKPHALLSKLKLEGDTARAMQLGMELIQRPR
jgi:hypothetical protein